MLLDDGTEGLSELTIGAAIDVHKKFGPGLLEKVMRHGIKRILHPDLPRVAARRS